MTAPVDGLSLVRCGADGFTLLVDPWDAQAVLWHTPDGAHRLIPPPAPGPQAQALDPRAIRLEVLAVAVRLRDLADDLDNVLARLSGVDLREGA